jgi:septal ring factor EnvC (AmiA/AmiB activator)
MTPTLSTSTLKDVASLSRPATVVDVSTEKNNYAKIYQDIQDAKQEIKDKKREGKGKEKEKAKKEAEVKQLKSEWAEIDKLKKTDEKKEKDANKRLATLSKISTPNILLIYSLCS